MLAVHFLFLHLIVALLISHTAVLADVVEHSHVDHADQFVSTKDENETHENKPAHKITVNGKMEKQVVNI